MTQLKITFETIFPNVSYMFDILLLLYAENRDDIKETLKKISRLYMTNRIHFLQQNLTGKTLRIHEIKSHKHKFLS